MKYLLITLLGMFITYSTFGQSSVQGRALDHEGLPVYFANVILYDAVDSSLVKLEYTDEEGLFTYNNLEPGSYYFVASYVGLPEYSSDIISLDAEENKQVEDIYFAPPGNALEEVTVTAKKPLLEMKADRVVLNVEGSANASGSDAFTLLRQSPGVVIDNNDNIFMLGKSGLQVYINNKPSYLSGTDLAEYLKSIPSSEIESIEIITNPSSRYEAEGNAGIINIRLRRDKNLGANTSISGSYSIGERARYNGTVSSTYKSSKVHTTGSLTGYKGENINPFSLYREQVGVVFDQTTFGESRWEGANLRLGSDIMLNDKHSIGVLINGSRNTGSNEQESMSEIYPIASNQIDSILIASADSEYDRSNWNINTHYGYRNGDRSFTADMDYGKYIRDNMENQPNSYVDTSGTLLTRKDFLTDTPASIEISTLKLDYEQPLGEARLSFGTKVSNVVTDNTFNFFNVVDRKAILDQDQSNHFEYLERVSAGYINLAGNINGFEMQGGIRVEHTNSRGTLTAMVASGNEIVERNYIDLFPSLGISFPLNEKNSFSFSYSRRLNRPSYQDMNPFRNRLDELTYEQGNPFLNPEYTNNFQVSHSWNYKLNTSISYSHTRDLITRITDTTDVKAAYITWLNLADQHAYSINLSAPIPITSWWSSYTSLTGVRTHNSADFGEGKIVDLTITTFNGYMQHSFQLPGNAGIELSGWYRSPSVWGGTFRMDAQYSVNVGIQKKFMEEKLDVRLGIDDIFLSTPWSGTSEFGALFLRVNGRNDSRRVKLSVNYAFGNQNIKSKKRPTGLEDEQSRIKN